MPLDDPFRFSLSTYDASDLERLSETLRELERRFNDLPMFRNPSIFANRTDVTGTTWTTAATLPFNTIIPNQSVIALASVHCYTIAGAASKGEYRISLDLGRSDAYSTGRAAISTAAPATDMAAYHWELQPPNPGPHIAYLQTRPETAASTVRMESDSKLTLFYYW